MSDNLYVKMVFWRTQMEEKVPYAHLWFHKVLREFWDLPLDERKRLIAESQQWF